MGQITSILRLFYHKHFDRLVTRHEFETELIEQSLFKLGFPIWFPAHGQRGPFL
jgi:hypothetical protein